MFFSVSSVLNKSILHHYIKAIESCFIVLMILSFKVYNSFHDAPIILQCLFVKLLEISLICKDS